MGQRQAAASGAVVGQWGGGRVVQGRGRQRGARLVRLLLGRGAQALGQVAHVEVVGSRDIRSDGARGGSGVW